MLAPIAPHLPAHGHAGRHAPNLDGGVEREVRFRFPQVGPLVDRQDQADGTVLRDRFLASL
jgi:hypothetical protein